GAPSRPREGGRGGGTRGGGEGGRPGGTAGNPTNTAGGAGRDSDGRKSRRSRPFFVPGCCTKSQVWGSGKQPVGLPFDEPSNFSFPVRVYLRALYRLLR